MRFARFDCAKRTFGREGKNPVCDEKDTTEVMLRSASRKRLLQLLPMILILAALGGLTGCVGISLCVGRLAELGMEWVSWLAGAFCLLFAVFLLSGALYSITDACSQVAATASGVEERRFGKRAAVIPWDDLAEVGISLDYGRFGIKYRLYFAAMHPEPYQRARIDAEQMPRGSVIHLPWEEFQNLSALQAICPLQVPVPPVDQPDHTVPAHYDLLCYRRERSADGAWGESFADLLIASNKVLEQHYQKQRKQSRKSEKSD